MSPELPYFAGPPGPALGSEVPSVVTLRVLSGVLPTLERQHGFEWQAIKQNTMAVWGRGCSLGLYRRQIDVALWTFEQGYQQSPELVCRTLLQTLAEHRHSHKLAYYSGKQANQNTESAEEIALRLQLDHYADLYENF